MKKIILSLILILSFCLFIITKLVSIENLGQIGECFLNAGQCKEIKVINDIAYIGSEYGLIILDISNVNNPQYVANFKTSGLVRFLDIYDGIAAICVNEKLIILDVSDTSNPTFLSSYELSNSWWYTWTVVIKENYVFVGVYLQGFLVLDITNIYNPFLIFNYEGDNPQEMKIEDNYLYITTDLGNQVGFNIFDITDINNPTIIGSTSCPGEFSSGFELLNNFAFIAAYANNLQIIDVNDPYNPQLISECIIPEARSFDVAVDDNYAYLIGREEMCFSVIDVSDPFTPYLIEGFDYPGIRICNNDNNVFICRDINNSTTYNGVGFLNIENPTVLTIESEYRTGYAEKMICVDNIAYVANSYSGLKIIDISNPSNPTSISNFATICSATDVIVESNIAYVAVADSCLQIIDVSDPSQPFLLGGVSFPVYFMQTALNIDKFENHIYVGGNFMWYMVVINVSDPTNPVIVNQQSVNDFCYDVAIFENNLFLAGYWGGLQIFDLINPVYPVEVGYYPLDLALSVEANENIAFIGDPYASLRIFDTSALSNPILTETYSIGYVKDMNFLDNTLYVASSTGIHLYNVTNPYSTYESDTISDCYPKGIFPTQDYLYCTESFQFNVYGDTTLVSVDDNLIINKHNQFNLSNYPNPFNPITTISFSIKEDSKINLSIYNIKGQKVKTLINNEISKGNHSISWNGEDENNNSVSSGVYLYKLKVNNKTDVIKKCLLLK